MYTGSPPKDVNIYVQVVYIWCIIAEDKTYLFSFVLFWILVHTYENDTYYVAKVNT